MAFVKVEKRSYIGGDAPLVTMGAYLADGKAHKSKHITFRMTHSLVKALDWIPEKDSFKIAVLEGIGDDVGFIQLLRDETGYVASAKNQENKRQGVGFNVTIERFRHYVLNECPVSSQPVNHIVEGNTLIVECPDWLRFNPQSVSELEPEPKPGPKKNVEQLGYSDACPASKEPCSAPAQCGIRGCLRLDAPLLGRSEPRAGSSHPQPVPNRRERRVIAAKLASSLGKR